MDVFILFIGGGEGCRARWHRTLVFIRNYKMGKYIVLHHCMVECVLCFATIYFLSIGLLWNAGTTKDVKVKIIFIDAQCYYFLGDKNCGFMLGQYFFLLTLVLEDSSLWIGAIISKLHKIGVIENPITPFFFFHHTDSDYYREKSQYFHWVDDLKIRIWHIPAVLLTWLSIKYHYYLPYEVLIFSILHFYRTMTYFSYLLCAGDTSSYFYPFKSIIYT